MNLCGCYFSLARIIFTTEYIEGFHRELHTGKINYPEEVIFVILIIIMIKSLQNINPVLFLIIATILEVSGDALIRKCIYEHTGMARIGFGIIGTLLLLGYGISLNLAPVEFNQVVGLYIAILFIVWQIMNYVFFKTIPTMPVLVGGILIVAGGLIVNFWKTT